MPVQTPAYRPAAAWQHQPMGGMCGEPADYIIDAWVSEDPDDDPLDPMGACEDHLGQLIGITSLDAVEVAFEWSDPSPDWVCEWDYDDGPKRYTEYLATQVSDIPRLP